MREELIRLVSEANTKLLENQKEIREQGWIRRTFWAVDPLDQSSLISEINIALSSYLPIARTSAREFEKQQAQIAYEKRDRALQNLMFMYGNMLQAQPKRINCHSSKFGSQYTTNCTY